MDEVTERMLSTLNRVTDLLVVMDATVKAIIIKLNDLEARVEELEAK